MKMIRGIRLLGPGKLSLRLGLRALRVSGVQGLRGSFGV